MHSEVVVHQRKHAGRGETLLFCKKENLFILYISMWSFLLKGQNNIMTRTFLQLACTAMYTVFACGKQAG